MLFLSSSSVIVADVSAAMPHTMCRLRWSLPQSPWRTRLWAAFAAIKAVHFAKDIILLNGELGLWRHHQILSSMQWHEYA